MAGEKSQEADRPTLAKMLRRYYANEIDAEEMTAFDLQWRKEHHMWTPDSAREEAERLLAQRYAVGGIAASAANAPDMEMRSPEDAAARLSSEGTQTEGYMRTSSRNPAG